MEAYGRSGGMAPPFLTLTLNGRTWRVLPQEKVFVVHIQVTYTSDKIIMNYIYN
jgi:hypothetical protein